jgi:hypothetical protein
MLFPFKSIKLPVCWSATIHVEGANCTCHLITLNNVCNWAQYSPMYKVPTRLSPSK